MSALLPARPAVGVGAVVLIQGRVLLVRRGKDPLRGRWVIPGGTVELGETLLEAVVREVKEETDVTVLPREVLLVFDRILREGASVLYHYVIIDYLCDYVAGQPRAGSDAEAVALAGPDELAGYDLPEQALELVLRAFRQAGAGGLAAGARGE